MFAERAKLSPDPSDDGPEPPQTALVAVPRRRDKEHLRYVADHPCLVCGRSPAHAHHLRFAQPRAMGRKVSDEYTVPLCALHHRELHDAGNEEAWWQRQKVDPVSVADDLWRQSRDTGASEQRQSAIG